MVATKKDKALAQLMKNADLAAKLEKKRLDLENKGSPMRDDYSEMEYRHMVEVENASDERSKALYADEFRRETEIEHRLRVDPEAKALAAKLDKLEYEVDKLNIELDRLEKKQHVLEGIAGILFPEFGEEEEDEADEDVP